MSGVIRRIRAVDFRCLREVDIELDQFHVLVGANGSGKSALFDVLLFAGDLLTAGLDSAVDRRTTNFRDLVWGRPDYDSGFDLVLELEMSDDLKKNIPKSYDRLVVSISVRETEDGLSATLDAWPKRKIRKKKQAGDSPVARRWRTRMMFDRASSFESALVFEHPLVSRYVERTLGQVRQIALESRLLRRAVSPLLRHPLTPSRSLPLLVRRLRRYPDLFEAWKRHIRTVIADVQDIRVRRRKDDGHYYLAVVFGDGTTVPSWALSDGTLRLLALTIIAYLSEYGRAYLIEEPENGIHPLAVEAVFRSLSSAYGSQVLIATHSPVLLAHTEPKELLCFSKRDGETEITRGDEHPSLVDWQSAADVDLLFASDVLG